MRCSAMLCLTLAACAPKVRDQAPPVSVTPPDESSSSDVAPPAEKSPSRVTLRAGIDVADVGLVLETGAVVELPPHTEDGRPPNPGDLSLGVAQVLSIGSEHTAGETPVQLCPRAKAASIDAVSNDDTGCEWSSRWYFTANTLDASSSLSALITTAALAEDSDGVRYRLWIADVTFDQRVLTLTLDVAPAAR